jgi:hypothetical protein
MIRCTFGVLATLAAGGFALAQPAVPISTKSFRPAFVPNKPAQPIQQVASDAAVIARPAPSVVMPAPSAVPVAMPPANTPCPQYMTDVAAACGDDSKCGACDCLCGPPGRMWFGAEYLLWTTSGNNLPPLGTRGVAGNGIAGALGVPGTQTLIGGRPYNDEWRSGVRVYGGFWLGECQRWGVEGDYFYLGNSTTRETIGSGDGSAILARPIINNVVTVLDANGRPVLDAAGNRTFAPAAAPFQDVQLVSTPNVVAGQMLVTTQSEFTGAGFNVLRNLCCNECGRLDFLVGYRYLNLNDTLYIREDLRGLPGSQNNGTTFVVEDRFRTENHFHGVNLGLAWERRFGSFFLTARGSVALGNTKTIVDIDGATTITDAAGNSQRYTGGLLAQPSNIGRYELNKFAVVPEVGVRLGVQLTDHIRLYAGYNFLYWSNVVRTGDVIDLRVNASQIPPRTGQVGTLFPRFEPRYSDFWAHGVMFGVQVRY